MNSNVVHSVMRKLAMHAASFWSEYIRPMRFDATFILDGARVRITIDEYKTKDDTLPVFGRHDEDNGIAD